MSKTVNIQVSTKKVHDNTPGMIGLFFEDINYAADGGLYAEMIENRSFEAQDGYGIPESFYNIPDPGYAWSTFKSSGLKAGTSTEEASEEASIEAQEPVLQFVTGSPLSEENPHYMRLMTASAGQGFANKAYDGLCLKKGMKYHVSFYARVVSRGNYTARVAAVKDGKEYAAGETALRSTFMHLPFTDLSEEINRQVGEYPRFARMMEGVSQAAQSELLKGDLPASQWVKYELDLTAQEGVRGALFTLTIDGAGIFEFDFVSMIPEDAVAGVFRKDLFEALKALKPGFIRFPGGCIVEGTSLANRYRWKKTVGPQEQRKVIMNLWAYDDDRKKGFASHRAADSHYVQSYGIGFYEYFLLCELLGAEPLPVLNVGLACQFRTHELVAVNDPAFQEFIQDALDLIEFANGSADTEWGSLRAKMGHPEPFGLKLLGAGNEQWNTKCVDFTERAGLFEKAIHEVYPQIRIVGSAGPMVESPMTTESWDYYRDGQAQKIRARAAAAAQPAAVPDFAYAVDEHYYVAPEWLYEHVAMYDDYPREVGVFAGEYAAHTKERENTMEAALAEAAFLTGVENNGDVVKLASYAPLFNRIGHSQWKPDLIWFDDQQVYLTPSYYVQMMYSNHAGDAVLDLEGQAEALRKEGLYINLTGKYDADGSLAEIILKAANANAEPVELAVALPEGAAAAGSDVKVFSLTGTGEKPEGLPEKAEVSANSAQPGQVLSAAPMSFNLYRIPLK